MTNHVRRAVAAIACLVALVIMPQARADDDDAKPEKPAAASQKAEQHAKPDVNGMIRTAVDELVKMQESDGNWPYEGVYRVNRQIPVGYHIGGTALVCEALLYAAPENRDAMAAVSKGVDFVIKTLDHPLMKPSTEDRYDVRIWGHTCALSLLCRVRDAKVFPEKRKVIDEWIPRLVETIVTEEIKGGGWNYANQKSHASFVTAPTVQALLLARSQGEKVPNEVLTRARDQLNGSRAEGGEINYSGTLRPGSRTRETMAGSIARASVSATTLRLLGAGSEKLSQSALDAFYEHWNELEKRRKQNGTHVPPHGIAPYYFYYGHRYAAQAIQLLPESRRAAERVRFLEVVMRTRDEDGTWNDRVFPRSRNFGTAMIVLGLLGDKVPLPPAMDSKPKRPA